MNNVAEPRYDYLVATRCFTYNHADYIEDALRGFALQETDFPCVFIVVDDASCDGEQDVLRHWASENLTYNESRRAKWETMPYGELTIAPLKGKPNSTFVIILLSQNHYQKGNSIKRFDYIAPWFDNAKYQALCEGDDFWTVRDKLQRQVDFLENNPEYTMCYAKCRYYYQSQNRFERTSWGGKSETFQELLKGNTVPTLAAVSRSAVGLEYREQYEGKPISSSWQMGDYPFWLFCSVKGEVFFMDWETGVYRVLDNSASHSRSIDKKMAFSMSMVDIMEFFNKEYAGGYSSKYFVRLRHILRLRTYAIYGKIGSYLKEWFSIARKNPLFLFDIDGYKYFSFFLLPFIRKSKK